MTRYLKVSSLIILIFFSKIIVVQSEETLSTRALVSSDQQAILSSEIDGKIINIPIKMGQKFLMGETLIDFDCNLLEAQHQAVEANLNSAQITLRSNVELAQMRSIGIYEVELSQAAVDRAEAELLISSLNIKRCSIKAPYNGQVANVFVKSYESIDRQQPLIEIIGTGILEARLMVPSKWMNWMQVGMPISILIDETENSYTAKIEAIGANIDPVSQTIDLRAKFIMKYDELLPGMSGTVTFE